MPAYYDASFRLFSLSTNHRIPYLFSLRRTLAVIPFNFKNLTLSLALPFVVCTVSLRCSFIVKPISSISILLVYASRVGLSTDFLSGRLQLDPPVAASRDARPALERRPVFTEVDHRGIDICLRQTSNYVVSKHRRVDAVTIEEGPADDDVAVLLHST